MSYSVLENTLILKNIFRFLSFQDLLQVRQVNTLWFVESKKNFLARSKVSFKSFSMDYWGPNFDTYLSNYYTYNHHNFEIQLISRGSYFSQVELYPLFLNRMSRLVTTNFQNITSLSLTVATEFQQNNVFFHTEILSNLPNLEELSFTIRSYGQWFQREPEEAYSAFPTLNSVKRLRIAFEIPSYSFVDLNKLKRVAKNIITLFPGLHHFEFDVIDGRDEFGIFCLEQIAESFQYQTEPFSKLCSLKDTCANLAALPIWLQFPVHLKKLKFCSDTKSYDIAADIQMLVEQHASTLESLSLGAYEWCGQKRTVNLPYLPKLKRFMMRLCIFYQLNRERQLDGVDTVNLQQLLELGEQHFRAKLPSLRKLVLIGKEGFQVDVYNRLLPNTTLNVSLPQITFLKVDYPPDESSEEYFKFIQRLAKLFLNVHNYHLNKARLV